MGISFTHADGNDVVGHDFPEDDIDFFPVAEDVPAQVKGHGKAVILPLPGNERRPYEHVLSGLAVAARYRIKTIAAQPVIEAVITRSLPAGQDFIAFLADPAAAVGKAIGPLHIVIDIDQFIRIRIDDGHFFIELVEFLLVEDQAVANIDGLPILLFFRFSQAFPQQLHDLIEILALRPLSHGVLQIKRAAVATNIRNAMDSIDEAQHFIPEIGIHRLRDKAAKTAAAQMGYRFIQRVEGQQLLRNDLQQFLSHFIAILLKKRFVCRHFEEDTRIILAIAPIFIDILVCRLQDAPEIEQPRHVIDKTALPELCLPGFCIL